MPPRHARNSLLLALLIAALFTGRSVLAADGANADSTPMELSWQRDLIARLSGATPLDDGRLLSDRSTRENRSTAAELLSREITQRGLEAQQHHYRHPNIHPALDLMMPPVRGTNVYATIAATVEADSHVVIGAHYDSVPDGPGANDNATGIAAVLAVAAHLATLEQRRMHFIIVFFDHEEDDGFGSRTFAQKLVGEGIRIHSMHNVDMVGWDSNGDRAVEVDMPTATLESLYRNAAKPLGIGIRKVRYNSTDHQSFRDLGIDATCLSEQYASGDTTPHHHKPSDTADAVDFGFLASSTQLMIAVADALAGGRTPQ